MEAAQCHRPLTLYRLLCYRTPGRSTSDKGQKTVLTAPKRHFWFTRINGHCQTGPVGPVGAKGRHPRLELALLWQIFECPGFPNRLLRDLWVVGFWRADHGGKDIGLEAGA